MKASVVCGVIGAFVLSAAAVHAASPADTQAMSQAATGFYSVYLSLHPSDGIPDAKLRARFAPYISPALAQLLTEADAAEQHYLTGKKNIAPPIGDIFSSNFDGVTSLKVGTCAAVANGAQCAVAMTYVDGPQSINWTDTVQLVHTDAGWRVDNIVFARSAGDDQNKADRSLTDILRALIRNPSSASQ